MTRIRIDMVQGIIEAEGSEEFVRSVYDEFKVRLSEHESNPAKGGARKARAPRRAARTTKGAQENKVAAKAPRKGRSKLPQIVSDLDLSGSGKMQSLRDFFAQYRTSSNFEKNLIFIYYLKNVRKLSDVGVDHVFTCYRNIPSQKVPGNLEQSLVDTRARKGWIDTKSLDDITLTVHGINHLEHDLPKADKK